MRIKAPLKRDYYPAAHYSGHRATAAIRVIILHGTEGDSARGAASWFKNSESSGSAHITVDNAEGYRCLEDDTVAWGAPPKNSDGLHIEHAAHASWGKATWLQHRRMLERSAFHVAHWCKAYGIPVTWLGVAELRAGKSGITIHRHVTEAWHQSTHTCPGFNFPQRFYMRLVHHYR